MWRMIVKTGAVTFCRIVGRVREWKDEHAVS